MVGHPVAHSRSPEIHAAFSKQLHVDVTYERILSPLTDFTEVIESLRHAGYSGVNVTAPFKAEAFQIADLQGDRSVLSGVANTLVFAGGIIFADNTDGIGFCRDVQTNLRFSLLHKEVLIVGAGGAAACILPAIREQQVSSIKLANRSMKKAQYLVDQFSLPSCSVTAAHFDDIARHSIDLVINTTSLPFADLDPSFSFLRPNAMLYDISYVDAQRCARFRATFSAMGYRCFDGIGMLVEKAAESFFIWEGVYPETKSVLALIHSERAGTKAQASTIV